MSTLTLEEQAAPSTPGANKVVVYGKADGLMYSKDDAGLEQLMSGVSISSMVSSLGADVNLSTTAAYFDGPSIAQGTSGTWFASGGIQLTDTAGAANFNVKLWDGTTVIASGRTQVPAASQNTTICISGFIVSPTGNIRISARDVTSTSGLIQSNASGNSKDSTITAIRIA